MMGCCDSNKPVSPGTRQSEQKLDIRETVREGYGRIAEGGSLASVVSGGCCATSQSTLTADHLAEKMGYSAEEIKALPDGANMGLSCGNPTAIADLKPGQVVLDLGSGGGFDCFLAGPKVTATGRVIGVDMTPAMLTKARRNLTTYTQNTGLANVEFRLGEIEHLPVADNSIDIVISNCVINLSPDKAQIWREIARVLKPGGRAVVSDLALLKPLPPEAQNMVEALIGCIAGAVLVDEYRRAIVACGLVNIRLIPKPQYIATLGGFKDPLYAKVAESLPPDAQLAEYVTSLDITAIKT